MFLKSYAPKLSPKQTQLSFLLFHLLLRLHQNQHLLIHPTHLQMPMEEVIQLIHQLMQTVEMEEVIQLIHQLMLTVEMGVMIQQTQLILQPKEDFKTLTRQFLVKLACPHLGLSLLRLSL